MRQGQRIVSCIASAVLLTLPASASFAQGSSAVELGAEPRNTQLEQAEADYNRAQAQLSQVRRETEGRWTFHDDRWPTKELAEQAVEQLQRLVPAYQQSDVVGYCRRAAGFMQDASRRQTQENNCNGLAGELARYRDALSRARRDIAAFRVAETQEVSEQAEFERERDQIRQGAQQDADFLASANAGIEQQLASQNRRSLDDFLADLGPSERPASAPASSGGDFLADLGPETASPAPSSSSPNRSAQGGDFLAASAEGDFLSQPSDVGGFEIAQRDDTSGVVDALGRTLIPFRNWRILQYQSGIAEVEQVADFYICSNANDTGRNYSAMVEFIESGFVDASGEFLDTPTKSFREPEPYVGLTLTSSPTNQTAEERRAAERRAALARERRRAANRQCDREKAQYKQRMLR